MLDAELDAHAVLGTLLDGERCLFERRDRLGRVEVDDDGGAVGDEEGELENDNLRGVSECFSD